MNLSPHTIARWWRDDAFRNLVDELTVATGIAQKAERLRIAKQVVRQKMMTERWSKKDLLDWLKFAREEMSDSSPVTNVNLLIANSFNNLPPELRPAAYLELAKVLFQGPHGEIDPELLSRFATRETFDLDALLGGAGENAEDTSDSEAE